MCPRDIYHCPLSFLSIIPSIPDVYSLFGRFSLPQKAKQRPNPPHSPSFCSIFCICYRNKQETTPTKKKKKQETIQWQRKLNQLFRFVPTKRCSYSFTFFGCVCVSLWFPFKSRAFRSHKIMLQAVQILWPRKFEVSITVLEPWIMVHNKPKTL